MNRPPEPESESQSSAPLAVVKLFLESPAATREAGLILGKGLSHGALVLLKGDLGSGKTTLIKAACEALGIPPAAVISPTYTLVNIYPGRPSVYHVDLYRIDGPEALKNLDEQDWINPDGLTFIEWPEAAQPLLAGRSALRIHLFHEGSGRMLIASTDDPQLVTAIAGLNAAFAHSARQTS